MIAFASVATGADVSNEPFDEILAGVNGLRKAANSAASTLSWADIAGPPAPADGAIIMAEHVEALRTRVNAARGTLGFGNWSFTDTLIPGTTLIRAVHITELQEALR